MSKMTLAWHKACFANMGRYLDELLSDAQRAAQRHADLKKRVDFYAAQIKRAEDKGMDSFDRERFAKKLIQSFLEPDEHE